MEIIEETPKPTIASTTEVVFILDRSGSMEAVETDTIGGFNTMLKKQQAENSHALLTTVLFDNEMEILHNRVPIEDVPLLTNKEYYARGTTALLDAVGKTIEHISNIHKYVCMENEPAKTLFIITTDGYENSSVLYTKRKVKSLINQKQKDGWTFLFLGANIDAVKTAKNIGIEEDYAADFLCDEEGIDTCYNSVSKVIGQCCRVSEATLPKNWKKQIDEDFLKRKK
jgi:uncharacterized protein YegL